MWPRADKKSAISYLRSLSLGFRLHQEKHEGTPSKYCQSPYHFHQEIARSLRKFLSGFDCPITQPVWIKAQCHVHRVSFQKDDKLKALCLTLSASTWGFFPTWIVGCLCSKGEHPDDIMASLYTVYLGLIPPLSLHQGFFPFEVKAKMWVGCQIQMLLIAIMDRKQS